MDFKFFKLSEFDCPCCGQNWIDISIPKTLDLVREELGLPITVTSGYRCEKHNLEVGGKKGSFHVRGLAVDCKSTDMDKLYLLMTKYFDGVGDGRNKGFIHGDKRGYAARWGY